MLVSETVEITGHLMDSGVLARVLDDVLDYGGDYTVDRIDLGKAHEDESHAVIVVGADSAERLARILMRLQVHGVNQVDPGEAVTVAAAQRRRVPGRLLLDDESRDRRTARAASGCRSSNPRWTAA